MPLFFQLDSLCIGSRQRVMRDTERLVGHMYRAVSEVGILVWVPQKHALKQGFEDKLFTCKVIPGSIGREK